MKKNKVRADQEAAAMLEKASRDVIETLIVAPGTDVPRVQVKNLRAGTIVRVFTDGNLTYLLEVVDPEALLAHVALGAYDNDFDGGCVPNCTLESVIEIGSPLRCGYACTPQVLRVTQLH